MSSAKRKEIRAFHKDRGEESMPIDKDKAPAIKIREKSIGQKIWNKNPPKRLPLEGKLSRAESSWNMTE